MLKNTFISFVDDLGNLKNVKLRLKYFGELQPMVQWDQGQLCVTVVHPFVLLPK